MSLKAFHVVFIVVSIALTAWVSSWGIRTYIETRESMPLMVALFSLVGGVALVFYMNWFLKKLKKIGFLSLAIPFFFFSDVVSACPVCMNNPNSPLVQSAAKGIWFLMAVISTVLMGFLALFIYWAIRSYKLEKSQLTS